MSFTIKALRLTESTATQPYKSHGKKKQNFLWTCFKNRATGDTIPGQGMLLDIVSKLLGKYFLWKFFFDEERAAVQNSRRLVAE